jgi:hypothetical protein
MPQVQAGGSALTENWLCQLVQGALDRINALENVVDRVGLMDFSGGARLIGNTWEVSNAQIANWVAETPLPLSSASQYARFIEGKLEIRGGRFDISTAENGARMSLDAEALRGYTDLDDLTIELDWAQASLWAKKGGFGGTPAAPKIVLNEDGSVDLVDLGVSGMLSLVSGGIIQSDNFLTGVSGWQVHNDGSAEFQDVLVRGTLDTVVFKENTVSTVGGTIRVELTPTTTELTAGLTIPLVTGLASMDTKLVYPIYEVNDEITVVDPSSDQQGTLTIFAILSSGEGEVSYLVRNDGDATPYDVFPSGSMVYGVTGDPGYLLMTANPVLGGPRYAVVDSSGGTDKLVGVFGNLEGAFNVGTKKYGIGIGDFAAENYLVYEPTGGFVMKAGGGAVTLDANGISVDAVDAFPSKLKFIGDQGNALSWLFTKEELSYVDTWFASIGQDNTHHTSQMYLMVTEYNSVNEFARFSLSSRIGGNSTSYLEAERFIMQGTVHPDYDMNASLHGHLAVTGDVSIGGSIDDTVPISIRVSRRATPQTLTTGAITVVSYDTAEWVRGSPAASRIVSSANRMYAKTAGLYLVQAEMEYATNGTGRRWAGIRKNGTNMESWVAWDVTLNATFPVSTCATVWLEVDDYVEMLARQTSGGNLDLALATDANQQALSFTVTRIA